MLISAEKAVGEPPGGNRLPGEEEYFDHYDCNSYGYLFYQYDCH